MNRLTGKLEWIIWSALLLVMLGIFAAYIVSQLGGKPLEVFSRIPDFKLTDQNGKTVTLSDLRGNVWVADVIFTRCPGQCLRMSKNMAELQSALPAGAVKLVSITIDPKNDSPEALKKYGEHFSAKSDRWLFLTGDKRTINRIAVDGMKLTALDKPVDQQENPDDLFIHSEKFVLIDARGQVRGWFDGEDVGQRPEIVAAVKKLLREK